MTRTMRRGASLVEMVVAMGTASVVLGVGIGTLHLLMRAERSSTASAEGQRSVARLSRVFREDVRSARDASLVTDEAEGASRLELVLDDETRVEYRPDDRRLLRLLYAGESVRHRDAFPLPRDALVEIEREDEPLAVVLRLALPRAAELAGTGDAGTGPPATVYRLLAAVGRDRRWEGDGP